MIGSQAELVALRAALGEHALSNARLHWSGARRIERRDVLRAGATGTLARCFIDLTGLPSVRLYFADAGAERFLIRDLSLALGLDELGKEALAQVIASSLEALLEAGSPTLSRSEISLLLEPKPPAEPPASSPAATARPRARPILEGTLSYAMRGFTSDAVSHGPGVGAAAGLPWQAVHVVLWVGGQYFLPQEFQNDSIGARFSIVGLRAGLGLQRTLRSVVVGARLGVGTDLVELEPRAVSDSAAATEQRLTPVGIGSAALVGGIALSPKVSLSAALFADADFEPRHYDVNENGQVRAILEPWPVKPGLSVGLSGSL